MINFENRLASLKIGAKELLKEIESRKDYIPLPEISAL